MYVVSYHIIVRLSVIHRSMLPLASLAHIHSLCWPILVASVYLLLYLTYAACALIDYRCAYEYFLTGASHLLWSSSVIDISTKDAHSNQVSLFASIRNYCFIINCLLYHPVGSHHVCACSSCSTKPCSLLLIPSLFCSLKSMSVCDYALSVRLVVFVLVSDYLP
jgi:hypothetical protein